MGESESRVRSTDSDSKDFLGQKKVEQKCDSRQKIDFIYFFPPECYQRFEESAEAKSSS